MPPYHEERIYAPHVKQHLQPMKIYFVCRPTFRASHADCPLSDHRGWRPLLPPGRTRREVGSPGGRNVTSVTSPTAARGATNSGWTIYPM